MILYHGKNINEVFEHIIEEMVWLKHVDLTKSPSVYAYDNFMTADTCNLNLNLASVGLTKNRWARFLTQYVRKEEVYEWLTSIETQRPGVINLLRSTGYTKATPDHYHPERVGHKWGVCFLGISFRKTPTPTLTLYSRTARMPTTAIMELNLVHQLAKEISERCKLRTEIKFVWFCSALHVTCWDILPYLVYGNFIDNFISMYDTIPLAKFVSKQYDRTKRLKATPEEIPYGRQRRITKRVQEIEKGKPLPDCWTTELSVWRGYS